MAVLVPLTVSFDPGFVVPIPTLPLELIRTRSTPPVLAPNVFAPGLNQPVSKSPAKLYVGVLEVPLPVCTRAPPVVGETIPAELKLKIFVPVAATPIVPADGL